MRDAILRVKLIGMVLLLIGTGAAAQQPPGDLFGYLPKEGEVCGWKPDGAPKTYRGEELFRMIDGGADIYHEYGFSQVVRATYMDAGKKSINLEIYRMKSPAAAYGIYTFKGGEGGKPLAIGQEARLQDYYLNFWKGDLVVTVIGMDAEEETVKGIVALAKAVDGRIDSTGKRPDLADRLLEGPQGFSNPKYIRGPLGLMGSYIFDTENIFCVREGMIVAVNDCRAFVFRYRTPGESAETYENATSRLSAGGRFKNGVRQGDHYSMVDREQAFVSIHRTGQYIGIVIGQNPDKVGAISSRLIETLKRG